MDVVGQNIANLNTTHGAEGKAFRRQQVVFETLLQQANEGSSTHSQSVVTARIENDPRAARLIYEPGHPDANSDGMVAVPEANLAVMKNGRNMALQALSIGKRS